jgi:hypothetical protein
MKIKAKAIMTKDVVAIEVTEVIEVIDVAAKLKPNTKRKDNMITKMSLPKDLNKIEEQVRNINKTLTLLQLNSLRSKVNSKKLKTV